MKHTTYLICFADAVENNEKKKSHKRITRFKRAKRNSYSVMHFAAADHSI